MEIKTSKRACIIVNGCLLVWFFLDMTGLYVGGQMLVSRSFADDGLYFVIFAALLILFAVKEKVFKYLLCGWLFIWFTTQFFSHWYYTIFGPADEKIRVFADTIKLMPSLDRYIPDLYHIILHLLILSAFFVSLPYCIKTRKKQQI